MTFPDDVGDVAAMVGYGDGGVLSVTVLEKIQGSVQVTRLQPRCTYTHTNVQFQVLCPRYGRMVVRLSS